MIRAIAISVIMQSSLTLFIVGCHQPVRMTLPDQALAGQVDAQIYGDAQTLKSGIEKALPDYVNDSMAVYECTEIATVQADLAMIDQAKTGVAYVEAVVNLSDDWDTLVALDGVLQKENLI